MFGHEFNDIAMRTTAKAVIEMLIVVNRKGRRFFVMERAAGFELPPGARDFDPPPDNIRQGQPIADFIQKLRRDSHPLFNTVFSVKNQPFIVIPF